MGRHKCGEVSPVRIAADQVCGHTVATVYALRLCKLKETGVFVIDQRELGFQRPGSVTDSVYDAIRESIILRRLPTDGGLTETDLARRLGVSKTPVREALFRLHEVGLIRLDGHRRGRTIVGARWSIDDAYEVRATLEGNAAQLAAERASDGEHATLDRAVSALRDANEQGDDDGAFIADREFHIGIARASRNRQLETLVQNSYDLVLALRTRDLGEPEASTQCVLAHERIARAITAHEGKDAERFMRQHIEEVKGLVLAGVEGA